MWAHALRATASAAVVIICTLLPFLPGPYDPLALPLSTMARVAGLLSLLFVPVGAFWIASSYWRPLAGPQHAGAVAALIVCAIVWPALSLAAFALGSVSLAVVTLAVGVTTSLIASSRIRALESGAKLSPVPAFYLLAIPPIVFLVQHMVLDRAVEFSRNQAIANSAPLIADIERYRVSRGQYPPSLLSVNKDYSPGVMGIDRFHYEPHGAGFNLVFEQAVSPPGTREFVVYNPRDEQTVTSHAMDLLQFTPELMARARGYYAAGDLPQRHWKYFWFD